MKVNIFITSVLLCGVSVLADDARPNIVMIISDDQSYTDFGFMGHPHVQTPHLDRLANQSARYIHGYVPSSVCRPSLATLLTGLYPHQHGVHFNHPPPGNSRLSDSPDITKLKFDDLRRRAMVMIRSAPSLPRLLAKAGYRCLQTGKHWEGHYREAGFTHGMTLAEPSDSEIGNKQLANGQWVAHGNGDKGLDIGRTTMQPIWDFLDKTGDEPFFIWYASFLPHTPHNAPRRFMEVYASNETIPEHAKPYYACCTWFDETVGQLVGEIEHRGLAKSTLFVFVVDNGFRPDPKRPIKGGYWNYTKRSKRSPFDDGLRTPILIRWDGRVKPASHEQLCSSVDLVPTLLQAAGLPLQVAMPGISLLPSAFGQKSLAERRPVFGEIYPGDASSLGHPSGHIAYRWVRQGDLKLIVPHRHNGAMPWNGYLTQVSMFNVVADPGESDNLALDPHRRGEAERLRELLDAWWTPGNDAEVPKP